MGTDLQRFNCETKLQEWSQRIADCRSSGLQVKQWCQKNGIAPSTYYTWQRRVFDVSAQPTEARFVELPVPHAEAKHQTSGIAASLQWAGTSIDFHNGADPATIMAIIQAMKSC
jgi:hypothetical protein